MEKKESFLDTESLSFPLSKYFQTDSEKSDEEIYESDSFTSQSFYDYEIETEKKVIIYSTTTSSSCYENSTKQDQSTQNKEEIGFLDSDIPLISPESTETYSSESEYETSSNEEYSSSQSQSDTVISEKAELSSYSYSYGSNYISLYFSAST